MRYILNSSQMKQCDINTMEYYGMLSAVLMERAALSAAEELLIRLSEEKKRILIACGTGNNGGDGLAMARILYLKGYEVTVLFPGKEERCSDEAARQLEIVRKYQIPIVKEYPSDEYDVIVDALFGIGLCREISGIYHELIYQMNRGKGYKMAVDISSGVSADNGSIMGIAFRADLTVTFGFAKSGQLLYPGADYTGHLEVKDIGIDKFSLLDIKPDLYQMEASELALLPKRTAYSNKGSYGKLLIVAGSHNMAGAAAFSAKAAYRTGSGLVKIVTEESNREIIQTLIPEAILATYEESTPFEDFISQQLDWADAVIVGPGIGLSEHAAKIVNTILSYGKIPTVVDADGLNLIARHTDWLKEHLAPVIVTPHLGEMSRLTGLSVDRIQKSLISVARTFSNEYDVITVLKDARTMISIPKGETYINTTGNHGMATAGSGDVLTGIIGSLMGQNLSPEKAAPLGVMLHGMAGEAAAGQLGMTSMMATDLIHGLCEVLKEFQ